MPIKLSDYSYVLANRKILCTCRLEAVESFLLDSLKACSDNQGQFKMYFSMNVALTIFDNWMYSNLPTINIYICSKWGSAELA